MLQHPSPLLKVNLPGASSVGIGALAKIIAPRFVYHVQVQCFFWVSVLLRLTAPAYRVLLMFTETVSELPGCHLQNCPFGSFLFEGGWGLSAGGEYCSI